MIATCLILKQNNGLKFQVKNNRTKISLAMVNLREINPNINMGKLVNHQMDHLRQGTPRQWQILRVQLTKVNIRNFWSSRQQLKSMLNCHLLRLCRWNKAFYWSNQIKNLKIIGTLSRKRKKDTQQLHRHSVCSQMLT